MKVQQFTCFLALAQAVFCFQSESNNPEDPLFVTCTTGNYTFVPGIRTHDHFLVVYVTVKGFCELLD